MIIHHEPAKKFNDVIHISMDCTSCGDTHLFEAEKADLEKRNKGALIQDAFPYLSANIREMFITGICGKCFDNMFKDDRFKGN